MCRRKTLSSVAIFESGPDGVAGYGYDDVVASLPFAFHLPKAIQPVVQDLNSSVVILHEDGQGGGVVTRLGITGGTVGIIPLGTDALDHPHLRSLEFGLQGSIGEGPNRLSGIPVDLAFDDQLNLGALPNRWTTFSAGSPLVINGKGLVREIQGAILAVSAPHYLFLAVPGDAPNEGVVDVIDIRAAATRIDTNPFASGIQSIPVSGVSGLMNYFRQ